MEETVRGHLYECHCNEQGHLQLHQAVTPVFKKNKKEDPGNYRPVSLTSIPEKMMEQLILEVINKQVEEKKVIRSSQHGFTKGKSCSFL